MLQIVCMLYYYGQPVDRVKHVALSLKSTDTEVTKWCYKTLATPFEDASPGFIVLESI